MKRKTPPGCATLAFLGGVAVFVWCAASALTPPEAPRTSTSGARAGNTAGPASLALASLVRSGTLSAFATPSPATLASVTLARAPASTGDSPRAPAFQDTPAPGDAASGRESDAASHPDALPPAAMRCELDARGVPTCGECRTDSDCPPQHGCVPNRRTRRFECMPSECEEDAHCFPGTLCRAVTDGSAGAVVRRCIPEGLRHEGERCRQLSVSTEDTCQEGLLCVQQLCGRPCRLGVPDSCPGGGRCVDTLNGPGCFPDCRVAGCADGQACTRVRDETYQCLEAVTGDCNLKPCADGERCNLRMSPGRAAFWCAARCNPLQPDSCAPGQVCGRGGPTESTCFQRCEPTAPDSCAQGWRCTTVSEDMTQWGCVPVP